VDNSTTCPICPNKLADVIEVRGVQVDPATRTVRRDGREIRLARKEYELLLALMERAGEIVTRDELMRTVWQTTFWTSAKTIDVHLGWLRRKLGDDPRNPSLITTIRGRGLRFERVAPPAAGPRVTGPSFGTGERLASG
jgi:DNA-binding response OmpR family regulator